jgi:hypothetical protein
MHWLALSVPGCTAKRFCAGLPENVIAKVEGFI